MRMVSTCEARREVKGEYGGYIADEVRDIKLHVSAILASTSEVFFTCIGQETALAKMVHGRYGCIRAANQRSVHHITPELPLTRTGTDLTPLYRNLGKLKTARCWRPH